MEMSFDLIFSFRSSMFFTSSLRMSSIDSSCQLSIAATICLSTCLRITSPRHSYLFM